MLVADREIFGQTFNKPQRRIDLLQVLQTRARATPRKNVELKHVHHLVLQDVLKAGPIASEELRHPLAQWIRHTARRLTQIAEDIALRKIAGRTEQHDGFLLAELMGHQSRESCVRSLRHARRIWRHVANFGIIMHEKVLGLDHLPAQLVELHLILTEIALSRQWQGRADRQQQSHSNPRTRAGEPSSG